MELLKSLCCIYTLIFQFKIYTIYYGAIYDAFWLVLLPFEFVRIQFNPIDDLMHFTNGKSLMENEILS